MASFQDDEEPATKLAPSLYVNGLTSSHGTGKVAAAFTLNLVNQVHRARFIWAPTYIGWVQASSVSAVMILAIFRDISMKTRGAAQHITTSVSPSQVMGRLP